LTDAAADALVAGGLDRLFEVDHDLPSGINEVTRSGHFAGHLRHSLDARPDLAAGGWSVDPEYNRLGMWPTPRDAISEQDIQQVRRRWARVQHRAKQARTR